MDTDGHGAAGPQPKDEPTMRGLIEDEEEEEDENEQNNLRSLHFAGPQEILLKLRDSNGL